VVRTAGSETAQTCGSKMTTASRFSDAALECKKLPADFWATPECVSRVLLGQGKTDEAIQVLETRYRQGVAAGSEVPVTSPN